MNRSRPNIVYILADDWGYGDVSCLNPESKIPTPFTDRLASRGMTFTDAHSNSAVCTPTRYGVLTGRYCWRGALKKGVTGGYDDLIIEEDRMTAASLLKQHGYRTACIGKWHLGLGWVRPNEPDSPMFRGWEDEDGIDYSRPLTRGPHTVGFDYSFIIPASLDIVPYCYIENGRVVEQPTERCGESKRPKMWRAGPIAPGLQHETCLLEFTMRAEQFIADHAQLGRDDPFFLYLPLPSPHTPHVPRKPFVGKSEAGVYGDYVVEHDWSIGRVLETLDRLDLADDTLVIVTSDNGPHKRAGNRGEAFGGIDLEGEFGHRATYIYRGQKSDVWDGGHRVPFFAAWPGVIEPGSTCDTPICLTDLLETLGEITGTELPDDAGEDSVSMLPLMKGDTYAPTRRGIVHHSVDGTFGIRAGDWKLLTCRGSGGWSLSEDDAPEAPPMQLYNLADDPEEQHNVYDEHREKADELLALLEQYQSDTTSK